MPALARPLAFFNSPFSGTNPYPGARLFAVCLPSRGLWPFQLSLLWHEPPRSSYFMRQLLNARAS